MKKHIPFGAIILIILFGSTFVDKEVLRAETNRFVVSLPKLSIMEEEDEDILWLARAIYSETKLAHEQLLIAWVIRNRVEAGYKGNTYQEVVKAKNQFSGLNHYDQQYSLNTSLDYNDYYYKGEAWRTAIEIATAVYYAQPDLRPLPETVLHFYSPISVKNHPKWIENKQAIQVIHDSKSGDMRFAFYDGVK